MEFKEVTVSSLDNNKYAISIKTQNKTVIDGVEYTAEPHRVSYELTGDEVSAFVEFLSGVVAARQQ